MKNFDSIGGISLDELEEKYRSFQITAEWVDGLSEADKERYLAWTDSLDDDQTCQYCGAHTEEGEEF